MITLQIDLVQDGFTLRIDQRVDGRVVAIVGPSGSGKTTVLEAIAGLRTPRAGRIAIGDRTLFSSADGIDLPARDRRVGYVPQDALLFPHMSVRGNILYGFRGAAGAAKAIKNVTPHAHVRKEQRVLRDVPDATIARREVDAVRGREERAIADRDAPGARRPQARDRLEHGRLSGSRRPDDRHDAPVHALVDAQGEPVLHEFK